MVSDEPEQVVRPIENQDGFHRVVREAMELYRALETIDLEEKTDKAAITRTADAKRKRLQPRYEARMARLMAYVTAMYPSILKGGDKTEFETDELIVRFHKDGNGTLQILDEAAFIAYLEHHPALRHLVKVVKLLANGTEFKRWWRAHPLHRPPARIVYRHSISFISKPVAAETARGKTPQVLKRIISEN